MNYHMVYSNSAIYGLGKTGLRENEEEERAELDRLGG